MRRYRIWLLLLALLLSLPTSGIAADLPYLTDRLASPTYRATLENLVRDRPITPWLRTYLATKNGVDRPGEAVAAAGTRYELYAVCEPHNCAGNFLYVLYAAGGGRAVALLTREGSTYQFFGTPSEAEKDLLIAAARN